METEGAIRISLFILVFIAIAYWERRRPRRDTATHRKNRWLSNIALTLINTLTIRLVFPMAAVGMAFFAEQNQLGLLNIINLPMSISILASIIFLDLFIYFQHVLFHAVPALWRLHMVHHTDTDYDLTTGFRFHPIEIVLSMGLKSLAILAIGPPIIAVLVFEILLSSCAMFNHGNIKLPEKVDAILRRIIVTPDMHRVHHSPIKMETNSNFGFNLSIWDKLFGTYTQNTLSNQRTMPIGLENYQQPKNLNFFQLLKLPFTAKTGTYPINKSEQSKDSPP